MIYDRMRRGDVRLWRIPEMPPAAIDGRSPDTKDARAKIVALTARGQKERTEAGKAVASAEQKIRRKLGAASEAPRDPARSTRPSSGGIG